MYEKICKKCGTRLSSFYSTGMLGCSHCYDAFRQEILVTLDKIQGATSYVGKSPNESKLDRQLLSEYQMLINEKERATLEGRFTDMRRLSQEIDALGKELKRRGLI